MFDKALSYIPLGSIMILVFAYIKLKLFYLLFNIDISLYLNTTDILNLVTGDIIYLAFILMGPLFHFVKDLSKQDNTEELIRQDERNKVYNQVNSDLKALKESLSQLGNKGASSMKTLTKRRIKAVDIFALTFIGFIVIINIYFLANDRTDSTALNSYSSLSIFLPIYFIYKLPDRFVIFKNHSLTVLVASLISYLIVSSVCDYYKVKNDKRQLTITSENEVFKSSDGIKCIGMSSKYLFLKDTVTDRTIILNTDKIKTIVEH